MILKKFHCNLIWRFKNKKRLLLIILSAFLVLAGCSAKSLVLPIIKNTSGKVQIQTVSSSPTYLYNSYIISSKEGENVVVDPTSMPFKETIDLKPVAITSTHLHADHYDAVYYDTYTCKSITAAIGDIKTKDFHIYSIPSSHNSDPINPNDPNVIIVYEVNGLRIAHMGDVGQTKLYDDQLKELGQIDIAFMQVENSHSDMTLENEKCFKILEQFKPKIVIMTHYTDAAYPVIESKYGKVTEVKNFLEITKDTLPSTPMNFYHITNTHKYS